MEDAMENISIQLLRNATIIVEISGKTILIDPMFSKKSEMDPMPWSNQIRNPTIDLLVDENELLSIINKTDTVIITHLHPDHWDEKAQLLIPKNKFIICQPEDEPILSQQGFTNLHVDKLTSIDGVLFERVPAQHGHNDLSEKMAPASGFVIRANGKTLYVAGDTVWGEITASNLHKHQPDFIVVNAGAAQFNFGDPITMTADDVIAVAKNSKPSAKIIAVHMEAINHCYLTRAELKSVVNQHGFASKIFIPGDGEFISLSQQTVLKFA